MIARSRDQETVRLPHRLDQLGADSGRVVRTRIMGQSHQIGAVEHTHIGPRPARAPDRDGQRQFRGGTGLHRSSQSNDPGHAFSSLLET
jgi:hypothetical protein